MLQVRIKRDLRGLDKMERDVPPRVNAAVKGAAEALAQDIMDNWSPNSPSPEGQPPAIKTGNLDSSVKVEPTGRDEQGRFATTADAKVWFVQIKTSEGDDPQGRGEYAGIVEEKNNRPYVEPAIARVRAVFSHFFRRIFIGAPRLEEE